MDIKGRRRSTNIEDRRGQKFTFGNIPADRKPIDIKLDDAVYKSNRAVEEAKARYERAQSLEKPIAAASEILVDIPAKKIAGAVANGVIKARQKLGYRKYSEGGAVRGDGCCVKGKSKGRFR